MYGHVTYVLYDSPLTLFKKLGSNQTIIKNKLIIWSSYYILNKMEYFQVLEKLTQN